MKAQIFNKAFWAEYTDERFLKSTLQGFIKRSGFTVVGFTEHIYEPYGYSAVWLIAESHIAVHTFPEEKKAYIEISSCVEEPFNTFLRALENEGWL